jgi:hypothetical protein
MCGLKITVLRDTPRYRFVTGQARNAGRAYGVRSVAVAAARPDPVTKGNQ